MATTIPILPALPAGYVVTSDDMNNVASCCTFLLNKPMAMVFDSAGSQSIATNPSNTTISFGSKYFDTDGMWSAGFPARLTVQTPGWYKVRWGLSLGGTVLATVGFCVSTSGANNPGGPGNTSANYWGGYSGALGSAPGCAGGGGLWPFYLWAGDYIQLLASTTASGESTVSTDNPSWMSLEYISIQEA